MQKEVRDKTMHWVICILTFLSHVAKKRSVIVQSHWGNKDLTASTDRKLS